MLILGIETSCDETAAAVVADGRIIRSSLLSSQEDLHRPYGGVVPELACRRHVEVIDDVVTRAVAAAEIALSRISAIAVTCGPGLAGALAVGVSFAKGLSWTLGVPLLAVNHLEGHLSALLLEGQELPCPSVALIVSGGHTVLLSLTEKGRCHVLGETLDDAAGEAFDKAAKMLGLGYPGGPIIEERAQRGDAVKISFPRPHLSDPSLDFSFSGLKTALLYYLKKLKADERCPDSLVPDIAASYQQAIVDVLVEKTVRAASREGVSDVVIGGGVAANSLLRQTLRERLEAEGKKVHVPRKELCTDNAAMIAAAGYRHFLMGRFASLDLAPQPDFPLPRVMGSDP